MSPKIFSLVNGVNRSFQKWRAQNFLVFDVDVKMDCQQRTTTCDYFDWSFLATSKKEKEKKRNRKQRKERRKKQGKEKKRKGEKKRGKRKKKKKEKEKENKEKKKGN